MRNNPFEGARKARKNTLTFAAVRAWLGEGSQKSDPADFWTPYTPTARIEGVTIAAPELRNLVDEDVRVDGDLGEQHPSPRSSSQGRGAAHIAARKLAREGRTTQKAAA
jgi:hypothetical protein